MKRFAKAPATILILALVFSLSLNFTLPTTSTTALMAGVGVQAVSAGQSHTLALKSDGSLWAWGSNVYGQLGDGTTTDSYYPIKVLSGVKAACAGSGLSLAIKTDNTLWTWGNNYDGQVGDGTTTERKRPVKVLDNVKAVAGGWDYTLALKTDGSLWAWGDNFYGQLGDGTTTDRLRPVKVMDGVKAIAATGDHSMAIKTDNSLYAWGYNNYGQVGDATKTNRSRPVKILTGVKAIAAGYYFSMAIREDSSLWAWGSNICGQFGNGTKTSKNTPVRVRSNVKAISAGSDHSMVLLPDGGLWTSGWNGDGQLGDGNDENRAAPVKVLTGVEAISAGGAFSMAIKQDKSLWGWGFNACGRIGVGFQYLEAIYIPMRVMEGGPTAITLTAKTASGAALNNNGITRETVTVRITGTATTKTAKRNGAVIAWPSNGVFSADGVYALTAKGAAGSSASLAFIIDKTKPVITAKTTDGKAVAAGSYQKLSVKVTVSDTNLSSKWVKKNGTMIAWPSTGTFSASGAYVVTAKDKAGNFSSLSFTIDKTKPVITAKTTDGKAVATGSYQKLSVKVTVSDTNLSSKWVKKNGTVISWPSTNTFSDDGQYTVTAKDKAGNISSLSFTIDKTPPKITVKSTSGAVVPNNGTVTGKAVVTVSDATLLRKTAAKDGKAVSWPAGNAFTVKGKYTITATDKAGNITTYVFTVR